MGNCANKPTIDQKPLLVYWNIHSRGDFPIAFMYAGGIEYDLDDEASKTWPAQKDDFPFGQLPILIHGNLTIAQGGSINRYCAKLAGVYPDDPVEAALCDMYYEELLDIFLEVYKVSITASTDN